MVALASNVRNEIADDFSLCVAEGERLGLYGIFDAAGPLTAFGLASEAMIPVSLALRWLAAQTCSGYVVRDTSTGRYRTWCPLPETESAVMP